MATPRARSIIAVGAALALVACDQAAGSDDCNLLVRGLDNAAKCIVKHQGNAEALAADCPEDAAKFRTAGFTTHDATKIADSGIRSFYSTYYGKDFCKNFFPQWLTRKI
jgi:hypothetical protein